MALYPLLTTETFDPDAVWAFAKARGAKEPNGTSGWTLRYFKALKADAATLGISGRWMVAQWDLETGNPSNGNGGQSSVWVSTGNPGGIAVFPDGSTWGLTFTPETAARAQVTHMARYLDLPGVPAAWIATDARWNVPEMIAMVGDVTNVQDLGGGRWATNDDYADGLIGRYTKYFGAPGKAAETTTPSTTGDTAVALKAYRFVGLDKDVWLPDDITVKIDIVPSSVTNVRSNQRFTAQTLSTYHETANYATGANATSERNYLHGGAGGSYVGYNFAVDDKQIIQLTPLNETTWAAGEAYYNNIAWAVEQCVGGGLNLDKARRNAAALHGGLAAAQGWNTDDAIVQHNKFWGKDCPQIIRREGRWPAMQAQFRAFAAAATAAAGGNAETPTEPTTPTVKPVPITGLPIDSNPATSTPYISANGTVFIYVNDIVEATEDTHRYQYADTKSATIGDVITKGTQFVVSYIFKAADGNWWYYTPWHSRILADHTKRVSDVNEAPAAA